MNFTIGFLKSSHSVFMRFKKIDLNRSVLTSSLFNE